MPVIHTQPGSTAFAAGKSMGQITREKEEYTRGVEEARLEMQRQQIEDARKMREIAQAFQEEQAILQDLQFAKTQELSREKMVQTEELAVLGHKEAMERTKLGEAGATGRTELGQAGATGRTELQQEGATGRTKLGEAGAMERAELAETGRMTREQMKLEKGPKETQAQKIRNANFVNVLRQNQVIKPGQLGTVSMDDVKTYDQITESLASQKVDPNSPEVKAEIDRFIINYFATQVLGKRLDNDEKKDAESFLEKYNAIKRERGETELEFVKPTTGIGSYWESQEKGKTLSKRKSQSKADQRATYNRLRSQGVSIEEAKKRAGIK